jgi:hypothetical protein
VKRVEIALEGLRSLKVCASSTQAMRHPLSDLIVSAVWSCIL